MKQEGLKIVIDSHYAPSVAWWALTIRAEEVLVERNSFYIKGTYRNRCYIYGANGALRLSVPLKHGKQQRSLLRDVEISYDHPWQQLHWESLCAAYRSTPYFEYYEEDLHPLYNTRVESLEDWNEQLTGIIAGLAGITYDPRFTDSYEPSYEGFIDLRERIHPNPSRDEVRKTMDFGEYLQVFAPKLGFLSDLSILDVLFHEGPMTPQYLMDRVSVDLSLL